MHLPVPFILLSIFSLLLGGTYVYIICKYLQGWQALPTWDLPKIFSPKTKVSVIIPARNEAKNILVCLQSIANQNYPAHLLEVIVIDDHSNDNTLEVAENFANKNKAFKVLELAAFPAEKNNYSFKKRAIATGIKNASGELIVTTDADCMVQSNWLSLLVSFYEKNSWCFIAAPVNFYQEKNLLEYFQSLDFMGMMLVTGAGIQLKWMNMCNGANLAYTKKAFESLNGFENIDHLASGDDILLMQKMAVAYPNKIGFLKNKNATVYTKAKPNLKEFVSQRLRWATKSNNYQEWSITFILGIVFVFCVLIVFLLLSTFAYGHLYFYLFLFLFISKTIADYIFLKKATDFFHKEKLMRFFLPAQLMHIAYIVFVGALGNIKKKYVWKGREVK